MKAHRENVDFWDKIAKRYDWITSKLIKKYPLLVKRIVIDINGAENVLEIATGNDMIALEITRNAGIAEAIYFSARMIEVAKSKAIESNINNIHFSVQNAYSLEFGDGQFDAALCSNALHCMNKPELALAEIRRVLKNNGILAAPTFCHGAN